MPRKKRTVDQLAQRRPRQEGHFREKNAAVHFLRWLVDQGQRAATVDARVRDSDGPAESARKVNPASAATDKSLAEPEVAGDAGLAKEQLDPLALLDKLDKFLSGESPPPATAADSATSSASALRNAGPQNQTPFFSPDQNEIARLQARARAEMQRADFVTALLEEVLGASTSRILKHQARLEAMQAQINALQGR